MKKLRHLKSMNEMANDKPEGQELYQEYIETEEGRETLSAADEAAMESGDPVEASINFLDAMEDWFDRTYPNLSWQDYQADLEEAVPSFLG